MAPTGPRTGRHRSAGPPSRRLRVGGAARAGHHRAPDSSSKSNPKVAALVADGEWVAWKSPTAGWPQCQPTPTAAASDPDATLVAVGADLSLWPAPGPAPGDTAVLSWHPGGCASAVLPVLATAETRLVVEVTPTLAEELGPYQWWAWEAPAEGWPRCARPIDVAGID